MLNTIYRLTAPRKFEIAFSDVSLTENEVVVKPTYLSICNADQRYFQGTRDAKVLSKKLPMALIHEGIGKVVFDKTGTFKTGDLVVMIPNTPTEKDEIVAENYLRSSKFRASGFDGFMREYISMPADRLVLLPDGVSNPVAAFTEIVSVCEHACSRFERFSHKRKNVIGVFGDGNMGFICALLLKKRYPESKVVVFGVSERKLSDFTFADETYLVSDIPSDLALDHAFECVGGNNSGNAINRIIDIINPEGTIAILGVSEFFVSLNTRMILEKGLRVFGSSRSGREDFQRVCDLYRTDREFSQKLELLVSEIHEIRNISDIKKAFEADMNKENGKTIMKWL